MVLGMADGCCDNKKDMGETGGVWWKVKEEVKWTSIAEIYVNMKIIMVLENESAFVALNYINCPIRNLV